MVITKDTLIADILKNVKGSVELFERHNMGCFSCMGVQKETLEKGCLMHGLDIDLIINELNNIAK